MEFEGSEILKARICDLLGKNKRKQIEAAYYTANNTRGYDLTIFYIPDERKEEIAVLLKKGKQVGLLNINENYLAANLNGLQLCISSIISNYMALLLLKEEKEQRRNNLKGSEYMKTISELIDILKFVKFDENDFVLFDTNKINKYIKTVEADYYKNTAQINALIKFFEGVTKWEDFGRFVTLGIKKEIKETKKQLIQYSKVVKLYVELLEQCSDNKSTHLERWGVEFVEPEKIEPDEATLKEWTNFLEQKTPVF